MVRWFWQNRLVQGVTRFVRLFFRWVLIWLNYLLRRITRSLLVTGRVFGLLLRPRDPNNLFAVGVEAGHDAQELATASTGVEVGGAERRDTLLWSNQGEPAAASSAQPAAISLWRGQRPADLDDAQAGAAAANRRFSFLDLMAAQLKRITSQEIKELDLLIQRLARKWLDLDEDFRHLPRRNRLDIGQTLRYNIPRYAGRILNFKWATKERPVPKLAKPAKLLVIGDVSHSMVHYVSVVLYFFHKLNFYFTIDSYVFSDKATHSAPFLNGLGTFEEKVQRLITGAKSWNAGTRFGSALEEIAQSASVDENTYVIIATDGKVSLQGEEAARIERYMIELRRRAKQVIFLTPSAEFSDGAAGKTKPQLLGSFKYDFFDIPIFHMGPPLWYGILGEYASRLYLIRTVQDLIDMTDDLILTSRMEEFH